MSTESNDGGEESPIDKTLKISEEVREADSGPGSMSFQGVCGYHTYFVPDDETGIKYATDTALHAAFDKAFQELWIGPDIVEENQGEFSPEAAARELELQLEDLFRIDTEFDRWAQTLVDEFEQSLREYQRQLSNMEDDA